MTLADVAMAAITAGGWVIPPALLYAATWALIHAVRSAVRRYRQRRNTTTAARKARAQQQRAERLADINTRLGCWKPTDTELERHIATWAAPRDPQTGQEGK